MRANQVYQEYIADKSHLHMNSTRWVTLTEFVKHLGRSGIAKVDETEKGWFIAWIDSSPKALAKAVRLNFLFLFYTLHLSHNLPPRQKKNINYQEASLKKDRATVSDEQREQQLIAEQISRAAEGDDSKTDNDSSTPPVEEGLKRDETSEKVVLSFSAKPVASSGSAAPAVLSTGVKINPLKAAVNPLKANPLKRPPNNNVFKSSALTTTSESGTTTVNEKKRPAPMSAAERLIIEEQERKRRRMDRDNMA